MRIQCEMEAKDLLRALARDPQEFAFALLALSDEMNLSKLRREILRYDGNGDLNQLFNPPE